jgi:predicted PolB exonuclease-like 3'-5' exonuclease
VAFVIGEQYYLFQLVGFMHNDTLTATDVETVPDTARMPDDVRRQYEADPKAFLPLAFHKIVAISILEAAIRPSTEGRGEWYEAKNLFSGGREQAGMAPDLAEKDLLSRYWGYFAKKTPRLLTWNGRSFDMVLLRMRAAMHGIQTPGWSPPPGSRQGDYGYRYSTQLHYDLADAMSGFGAGKMSRQDHVAAMMQLPGKFNGHGSEVAEMIAGGRYAETCDYCDGDVLNLFAMFLRWQHMDCKMSAKGYNDSVAALLGFLGREREAHPHLGEFADRWTAGGREILLPEPSLTQQPNLQHVQEQDDQEPPPSSWSM